MPPTTCRAVEPVPKSADHLHGPHSVHDRAVEDFESSSGFGAVRMMIGKNERGVWVASQAIDRVELVSLLTESEPSVYVLDEMATPALARQAKRRPLDEFEQRGLDAVRRGEHVVWTPRGADPDVWRDPREVAVPGMSRECQEGRPARRVHVLPVCVGRSTGCETPCGMRSRLAEPPRLTSCECLESFLPRQRLLSRSGPVSTKTSNSQLTSTGPGWSSRFQCSGIISGGLPREQEPKTAIASSLT